MPADEAIIQLVQAGREQEAFERLVPEYRRRVFGLAFSILRDRAAAEDLAQEVFVKLWQALPRYDGRAKLSTWIYTITRNASISALRARRPALSMSEPAVQESVENIAAPAGPAAADPFAIGKSRGRFAGYTDILTATIQAQYRQPPDLPDDLEYAVLCELVLDQEGRVLQYRLLTSSGSLLFDQSAIDALSKVTQVRPPPEGMDRTVVVKFFPPV